MKLFIKYFLSIILFFLLSILLLSCETIVDVNLPKHKPLLVVNSVCNPDKPWELNVSLSKGILEEGEIEIVKNAKVEILENGNPVSIFNHYNNGTYKSTGAKPKVDIDYKLRITSEKYGEVTSNCSIPKPVKIETVTVDTILNKYENKEIELTISFTDTPNKENFYSLSVIKTSEWNSGSFDRSPIWFTSRDLLIKEEGNSFEGNDKTFRGEEAFFDDAILDGKSYKLKIFLRQYNKNNKTNYEVVLSSLDKEYYKYIKTSKTQRQTDDNPFAEPTIIYSNIENGLGIFTGYSLSKYKIF